MSGEYLYLLRAACSWCDEVANLIEQRDAPVGLMQGVEIVSTRYCPACGKPVDVDGWDLHEEAFVERAEDPTEVSA